MYRVVTGVAPDDERALDKAGAVADLPGDPDEVAVTVVHAADEATDPTEVAAVAETLSFLDERGVECETVTVDRGPTEALLSVAEERDADCVVVGGRRRSPAGKLQLKSGAQQVILRAERPVLVAGEAN